MSAVGRRADLNPAKGDVPISMSEVGGKADLPECSRERAKVANFGLSTGPNRGAFGLLMNGLEVYHPPRVTFGGR
jgi:hypothetical protein